MGPATETLSKLILLYIAIFYLIPYAFVSVVIGGWFLIAATTDWLEDPPQTSSTYTYVEPEPTPYPELTSYGEMLVGTDESFDQITFRSDGTFSITVDAHSVEERSYGSFSHNFDIMVFEHIGGVPHTNQFDDERIAGFRTLNGAPSQGVMHVDGAACLYSVAVRATEYRYEVLMEDRE